MAHLAQHQKGSASTGSGSGQSLAARSFLGGLLPESLLYQLKEYGAQAFAEAMVGDSDTPELVWTHRMRLQRLVPQVRPGCRGCFGYLLMTGIARKQTGELVSSIS